jgi:hypothetical protein
MTSVDQNPAQRLSVKDAAKIAAAFIRDLLGGDLVSLRLEEVDTTEDEHGWLITLSFIRGLGEGSGDPFVGGPFQDREYKQVEVSKETGAVRAMRIRAI